MLSKSDIKKVAKKIFHGQRGRRSVNIMHPQRDWVIGVFIALLLIAITTTWSGIKYTNTKELIDSGVQIEEEGAVVYRESQVADALRVLESRQAVVEDFNKRVSITPTNLGDAENQATTTSEDIDSDNEEEAQPDTTDSEETSNPVDESVVPELGGG